MNKLTIISSIVLSAGLLLAYAPFHGETNFDTLDGLSNTPPS